jgi:hypothetical protein
MVCEDYYIYSAGSLMFEGQIFLSLDFKWIKTPLCRTRRLQLLIPAPKDGHYIFTKMKFS